MEEYRGSCVSSCIVRTLGMEDHSAVDISQGVHVQLLRGFGLCQGTALLRYGKPLPRSGLLEGVYSVR